MTPDEVYTVLVEQADAPEADRANFIYHYQQSIDAPATGPFEWRFQGSLGFGGKFYDAHGRQYIQCYREDETDDRLAVIASVNEDLHGSRAA